MINRLLAVAAVTIAAAAPSVEAGPGQWTVVATYDVPEGASGLAFDGTWLYCGIYGPNGGEIHRIDPSDGTHQLLFTGPQDDAFGLTHDGANLWTTHHPGSSSVPALALKLDGSGTVIDQITLPAHYMSGIAYDAGDFWVARYYEDPSEMFKVDATGATLRNFVAPDNQPWDICLENGNLWVADYYGDALYKIDPVNGQVLESHPSEGVEPAGIVWDGQFLWYCDNGEGGVDFLYKVDLQGAGTPEIAVSASAHEYGLVSIGNTSVWNATVFNTGDADLVINAVTFDPPDGLSCTATLPLVVPASGNALLPIEFTPTAFGPLSATATIASNDPVHSAEAVTLTGNGLFPDPTIDILAVSHDYGQVRVNANTRWFMEVRNHGNQTLTVSGLPVNNAQYYVDAGVTLPFDLAPLESALVGVWFNPVAPVPYSATLDVLSNDATQGTAPVALSGSGDASPYPMGDVLWSYTIDVSFDNSPKAMISMPDVSGDGVADVIICSEDNYVRCFNGNASGNGDVLWEHEIVSGSVYGQNALQIIDDIDEDSIPDVIVGTTGASRLVRAISGATGEEIWSFLTSLFGDGGWVYQVDGRKDYNSDGSVDILAGAGDDSQGTGPKRVFCINGLTGTLLWSIPLGGPVFGVISVDDFTGDGIPDAVAGGSDASETQGRAFGINGSTGTLQWTFPVDGSSVWALAQVGDLTGNGINDVMVGDFLLGTVYGLDVTNGSERFEAEDLGTLTRLERLDDVDGDGNVEVVPAHFSTFARAISSRDGSSVWTTPLVDKPANVARIPDVSGDAVNDVVVGTLFSNNRGYFLNGVDGSVLHSFPYSTPIDAITAIPDVANDGSWEMLVGGRNGLVTCVSGGLAVPTTPADINGDGVVNFADILVLLAAWGPNPGSPADVNGDGVVNFADILLVLANWS